ncbi:MAG TPA: hypothetical protein DEV81_00795 [Cyanobacteria bacterium UBA11049]|nr:hypothetical protein [Cyanobacteria bacterium UBA11049]
MDFQVSVLATFPPICPKPILVNGAAMSNAHIEKLLRTGLVKSNRSDSKGLYRFENGNARIQPSSDVLIRIRIEVYMALKLLT